MGLQVERQSLLDRIESLTRALEEECERKKQAHDQTNKYMKECEDLRDELLKAQKRFEDAAVHEQENIAAIGVLESKVITLKDLHCAGPPLTDSPSQEDQVHSTL